MDILSEKECLEKFRQGYTLDKKYLVNLKQSAENDIENYKQLIEINQQLILEINKSIYNIGEDEKKNTNVVVKPITYADMEKILDKKAEELFNKVVEKLSKTPFTIYYGK